MIPKPVYERFNFPVVYIKRLLETDTLFKEFFYTKKPQFIIEAFLSSGNKIYQPLGYESY